MFVRDSCSKQLDSDRLAAYVPELCVSRVDVHGSSGAPLIRSRPDTPGCCREPAVVRCAAASDSVSIVANGQPVGVCAMEVIIKRFFFKSFYYLRVLFKMLLTQGFF